MTTRHHPAVTKALAKAARRAHRQVRRTPFGGSRTRAATQRRILRNLPAAGRHK